MPACRPPRDSLLASPTAIADAESQDARDGQVAERIVAEPADTTKEVAEHTKELVYTA